MVSVEISGAFIRCTNKNYYKMHFKGLFKLKKRGIMQRITNEMPSRKKKKGLFFTFRS